MLRTALNVEVGKTTPIREVGGILMFTSKIYKTIMEIKQL